MDGDFDNIYLSDDVFDFLDLESASNLFQSWRTLLGISAFLDFVAAMLSWTNQLPKGGLLQLMKDNASTLGMVFSVLWFVNAFVEASREFTRAQNEVDKKLLLDSAKTSWWNMPLVVYCRTIFMQVLFLPVGFFVTVYVFSFAFSADYSKEVFTVNHYSTINKDQPSRQEFFTSSSHISLAFALIKYFIIEISVKTGRSLRQFGVEKARQLFFTILSRAAHHPVRFTRRIRKALRIVRWVKYLLPLIGTSNKLIGNLVELSIKWKQRRDASKARKIRMKLWDELDQDELREHCAILIQKSYRAHKARKSLLALQLFQGNSERIAAIKIQRQLRRVIASARASIARKRQKLAELQKINTDPASSLGDEDRRKMYELKQELKSKTDQYLNRKLLLRPNTNFAVAWKILFVAAVVFEIIALSMSRKTAALESLFDQYLVPEPLESLTECKAPVERPIKLFILHRLLRRPRRDFSPKWYCLEPYTSVHELYRLFIGTLVHQFFLVVSIICFLDVFVCFFMGQFDKDSGILKPRPPFHRWIAPGLALQLILNPAMDETATVLLHALSGAFRRGPVRVVRWILALFFPLTQCTVRFFQRRMIRNKIKTRAGR